MPVFGLNNGVIPIVAYNYGAQKKARIMQTFRISLTAAACIMVAGTLIFQFFPSLLLSLFEPSEEMLTIGKTALRIISLSFPSAAIGIVCSGVFQALGSSFLSMIVSLTRQLFFLLPIAWLLSLSGRLELVWWAFPLAEIASLTLTIIFFRHIYRRRIVPLAEAQA